MAHGFCSLFFWFVVLKKEMRSGHGVCVERTYHLDIEDITKNPQPCVRLDP